MVFQFARPERPVDENVRDIVCAELDRAVAEVGETGFEVHDTVRDVRRRLKRIRAVLKLVRPVFPAYVEESVRLRQIGADVSELRDAAALIDAAEVLAGGLDADLRDDLAALRIAVARHAAARDSALPRTAFLADLRQKLLELGHGAAHWQLTSTDPGAVLAGLLRGYARARRGFRRAAKRGEDEALHKWRRQVKVHAAHLSLLREISPAVAGWRRNRLKRLARLLGDHQNLCVLEDAIATETIACPPALARSLAAARARLARLALRIGATLFSEPPAVVETRWRAYVDEWRVLSGGAHVG